jgi:hypothetical protein
MGNAEILAELARLSSEDRAEVPARLDELAMKDIVAKANGAHHAAALVRTPRLADRSQAGAFVKHVTELPADAAL